jgi:hypothetical protein
MSFPNAQAEPRQLFLTLLMKNSDYLGLLMVNKHYTEAVHQMLRIATDIRYMASESKIKPIYEILKEWIHVDAHYTVQDVQEMQEELKGLLALEFYSELQLGIIPTSTLKTEKDVPTNKPMEAISSRL